MSQSQQLKPTFQIDSVVRDQDSIRVNWKDGHKSTYNNLWMMDACRCPKCFQHDTLSVNPGNNPITMPLDPETKAIDVDGDGNLKVVWDKQEGGHESVFDSSWLRVHCQSEAGKGLKRNLWDKELDIPTFEFDEVIQDDNACFEWLDSIRIIGVSIIENAPKNEAAFRQLSARVWFLHTRYHPSNIFMLDTTDKVAQKIQHAYKLDHLAGHTDLTAYTDSGVIQLLHCLKYEKPNQEEAGGESIIIDGFKIAQVLKDEYPEYYAQLTQKHAPGCRRRMVAEEKVLQDGGKAIGNSTGDKTIGTYAWDSYRLNHVIKLNESGQPVEVRFNHNTRAPFSMSHDEIRGFYEAYSKFVELTSSPKYIKQFLLKPGQVLICDNARALHGRTEVGSTVLRKVQGIYVKRESFKSRWRLLLGLKTGMTDFWLTGCTDHALKTLADRHA